MNPASFLTASLRAHPAGEGMARVMAAAVNAVDPREAVRRYLRREGQRLWVGDELYDLQSVRRVWVVGAGKAGYPMAQAVEDILGAWIAGGLVIVKDGYAPEAVRLPHIEIAFAAHPVPDERGVEGTRRILSLLQQAGADDLVLCLLSGGGSALLTAPAEGISLADVQALTSLLLACGAAIDEINALRKHIDQVKGGALARMAAPARVAALILSDVIGDRLDVIASGPCFPDESTFSDAWSVLERYALADRVPESIRVHLQAGLRGETGETPKPGDPLFQRVQNLVVASNLQAARAALHQARAEGWHTLLLTTFLQGEASQAGRALASIARQVAATGEPLPRPACLVAGGETTVTLHGQGLGGRNQELALGAVEDMRGLENAFLIALATDGGDGPTDAAGAVVSGDTLARAFSRGFHPGHFLARNDAYHFFQPLGDLLLPGPTRTNVNDLTFLFLL
ncbi:glycerate 2-kinase [Anaerolinea thermolimosa]|uniref:Glycerate 2-kinase n=1 Tax=Anaerolinea thermolimosa TaxID=229919 RepID=A0A7U9KP00_9CHLR|nr:glycerate kinase [Anaerolinea thermolimosa]GAP08473.1 glycerate 2-kinase [Anaerolinea thermolimosa]